MGNPEHSNEEVDKSEKVKIEDTESDGKEEERQNLIGIVRDMESSEYAPAMRDAAMAYMDRNLTGPSRGIYDSLMEKRDSLKVSDVFEAFGEVYLSQHPEDLERFNKGNMSMTDLFGIITGELASDNSLAKYKGDIDKKIAELYALNDHDFDKLIDMYQIEDLEKAVDRAKWLKEQRLRAPKAFHQQKVQEASVAFQATEKTWANVESKKSSLELVLMQFGYQSAAVEERASFRFDEHGKLILSGEPRSSLIFTTKEETVKREQAIQGAIREYEEALAKHKEASDKADAAAAEEEKAYQVVEKVSKQEDENIAKLETRLAEKKSKGKKKK